jgi:integrase/recombinase XerD
MSDETKDQKQQLPLFSLASSADRAAATNSDIDLTPATSLDQAIGAFEKYMEERGFTDNTRQAFRLDMELLSDYLGPGKPLGDIGTATLNAFLKWMESGRGVPCSPKTLERRITTLKVFFGWLTEEGFIPRDVAAPLIHQPVSAPLPDTLSSDEVAALLGVTGALRRGITPGAQDADKAKPDARPHLLLTLILHTGIKKSECTNIHLNHLDLSNPNEPAVWIRYKSARRRHKERRITLPPFWPNVLEEYLSQYPTKQFLFPWTGRNLEYILTGVAEQAGVSRLTFEMLRWTCALNDYAAGMDSDTLRRKMGLSEISWYEVEHRLELLSRRPT